MIFLALCLAWKTALSNNDFFFGIVCTLFSIAVLHDFIALALAERCTKREEITNSGEKFSS